MTDPSFPDLHIKYSAHPSQAGFSINTTAYSNFHFPKHFHNHYTIVFIEEGVNQGFTEQKKYSLGKNNLLIINPGELHAGHSFEGQYLQFKSLRLEKSFLQQLIQGMEYHITGDIWFKNTPILDESLILKTKSLINGVEKKVSSPQLEVLQADLLYTLIMKYSNQGSRAHDPKSTCNRSLEKARDFIQQNYQEEFSLQDIARHCHLSPYYLIRQFKKSYGLSPFQYLRNYRVEKAKELFQSNFSITEIALEVGFFDQSHFLRNFKKTEGVSPLKVKGKKTG